MLNEKVEKGINAQINAEMYSAYLYYSMSAWFEAQSLAGFAHWMRVQALEEMSHVQKFFGYVHERAGTVKLEAIDAPPAEWDSPLAVAEAVYEHETKVTGLINKLMDVALEVSDHATVSFLNWFIDEQVEEEASADAVVQQLKLVEQTQGGLFMVDRELDKRTFTPPPFLNGVF